MGPSALGAILAGLLAVLILAGCHGRSPGGEPLLAGVAVVDITPPVPYRMSGYFNERLSTGVANPLHAKALVLQQGGWRAAMVFCDLIGVTRDVSSRARGQAAQETGIPPENILIAATHSHTGPLYAGALRDHLHERAVAKLGSDPYEKANYADQLVAGLVKAISKAAAASKPVRLEAGAVEQNALAFNRRFHMKDGSVVFNPGVLNPNIVQPAGPTDPQVGVVLIRDAASGKAVAGIVNFAMHLDTMGGTLYAADYPFFLERALRKELGEDFVLLFGTGTCGDINHIDVTRKDRPTTEQIGGALAATVQAGLGGLKPVAPGLTCRGRTVDVPMPQFTPEQLDQARNDITKVGTKDLPFLAQVEACKRLNVEARGGKSTPLEVQVFRLGEDVAVVGLPGEPFVELGLAIKKASPFGTTLVIELCQDCPGYVPTKKAFAEGSYETVNSTIAPGGGEMLVEAARQLLKELAR